MLLLLMENNKGSLRRIRCCVWKTVIFLKGGKGKGGELKGGGGGGVLYEGGKGGGYSRTFLG